VRAKRAFVAGVPVVAGLVAAAFALADAPGPTLPAPKRGILERSMHPPAGGGGQPARKGRGAHEPPFAVPREPAHAGGIGTPAVLGGVPVPAPAAAFEVTNMSIDRRGTTYLNVYAGSLPPDHDRGALLVTRVNAVTGADLPGAGLFAAPAAVGPLRLSRVDAEVASFSYSGGTGTFDLATGQFTLGR
jgi:hypothetical protein